MRQVQTRGKEIFRVLDVATGEEVGDVLDWVKFSGASWLGNGFFYSRYPAPDGSEFSTENTFHSVYYHRVGTDQSEDRLVFKNEDEPNRYHFVSVSEDEKFLILNTSTGTDGNSITKKAYSDTSWLEVVGGFEHRSSVVGVVDGTIYLLTDIDAPKYRLVAIDSSNELSDVSKWVGVILTRKPS